MLCTQDDVEKHLQIEFPSGLDDTIALYIAQATATITEFCDQPLEFESGVVLTTQAESDSSYLILPRFPITDVQSVVEDGYTLVEGDDFVYYEDGRVRRVSGSIPWVWSRQINAVVVTYDAGWGSGAPAGYDAIPKDLVLVASAYTAMLYRHGAASAATDGTSGPVKSVSLAGSDAVTYDTAASNAALEGGTPELTDGYKALLAPYRVRTL